MCDPPMTPIVDGIQYVLNLDNELQSTNLSPQCWKCRGTGRLIIKESKSESAEFTSLNDKGVLQYFRTCTICQHAMSYSGSASTDKRISVFKNFTPTGPTTPGNVTDDCYQPRLGETLCSLSGHYMIYQYTRGHRFTTDDVCTAYFAYTETWYPTIDGDGCLSMIADQAHPRRSHLDLGCGLGSVLMMLKWKYGEDICRSVGVEAQHANLASARRSIAFNGLQEVCEIKQGDMKDFSGGVFVGINEIEGSGTAYPDTGEAGGEDIDSDIKGKDKYFDIITGTPPYFPLRNGALPQDAGRGQCAFECRGGIEAYLGACSRNLSHAASARCVLCQTYLEVTRTEASAKENGLVILKRLDVYGKEGQSNPLFSVFSMRKLRDEERTDGEAKEDAEGEGEGMDGRHAGSRAVTGYSVIPLYVRKLCGCHTAAYDVVMREMGRPTSTCTCLLKQPAAD